MKKNIFYKIHIALKPCRKRLIAVVLLFALAILLGIYKDVKVASLIDQNGWRTWNDDGSYGQVSIYFNHSLKVTPDSIREYDYKIFKALEEAALKEEGYELISCYSAPGSVELTHESKNLTVKAMGIGGDFFYIHPVQLVNGSYFDPNSDMKDQIVIDEDTAWNLFGSSNIVGQAVYINGIPHYISGVVKRPKDKIAKAAGLSNPIVYVSYQTLVINGRVDSSSFDSGQIQTIDPNDDGMGYLGSSDSGSDNYSSGSAGDGSDSSKSSITAPLSFGERAAAESVSIISNNISDVGGIACYELIMPDSVENYAANLVKEKLSFKDNADIVVMDSRARFSFGPLINIFRSFPGRSMQLTEFSYPYWENIARGWEDILAMVVMAQLLLYILVFLLIVWITVSWYNNRTWRTKDVIKKINDKVYDFQSHNKRRKNNGKIKKTS